MYIYLLRRCDSSTGIGKATRHHEFNNDEIGFCLLFSSRNRLSWADYISTAIKYAILYLHIILLVLPDTFYLDESGSGLFSEVGSGSGPDPQHWLHYNKITTQSNWYKSADTSNDLQYKKGKALSEWRPGKRIDVSLFSPGFIWKWNSNSNADWLWHMDIAGLFFLNFCGAILEARTDWIPDGDLPHDLVLGLVLGRVALLG